MRLLYSFPGALGARTGIGSVAWHHVESLSRRQADLHLDVVCARLVRPLPEGSRVRILQSLGGLPQRVVGLERSRRFHDRVVAAIVRRRRPDLVHVWPRATLGTAVAAHRVGGIVVREAPSPYTRTAARQASEAWAAEGMSVPSGHFHAQSEVEMRGEDEEFAACDMITVAAPAAVTTFREGGIDTPVTYIPQGFDPAEFPDPDPALPAGRDIAFVGRGEPTKGFHHLLRAWPTVAVPGSRLLVIGVIDERMASRYADVLARPDVVAMGYRSDVEQLLRGVRALVMPSHSEGGGPLVAYEAVGAGVVPVLSDRCGLDIAPGRTGLVHTAGDEEALAAHLSLVLDDETAARLRRAVVAQRSRWTWDNAAHELLALYGRMRAES